MESDQASGLLQGPRVRTVPAPSIESLGCEGGLGDGRLAPTWVGSQVHTYSGVPALLCDSGGERVVSKTDMISVLMRHSSCL